jgi:hypothetical protein
MVALLLLWLAFALVITGQLPGAIVMPGLGVAGGLIAVSTWRWGFVAKRR